MERIPRAVVVALSATAILCTAAGLSLHAAGGRPMPAGLVQYAVISAGTAALGAVLLWHRPGNRYGATHLTIGVLFGGVVLAAGVLSAGGSPAALPGWAGEVALAASWFLAAPLLPLWVIAIVTFPDGRFHRRVVRHGTVALALGMPVLAVLAYLLAPPGEPPPLIGVEPPPAIAGPLATAGQAHPLFLVASGTAAVLGALAPVAAVVALLHRFRTGGPVVRQQIKWLLVAAAVSVALQAVPVHAIEAEPVAAGVRVLVLMTVPLPLVAAAVAIFKHRLWGIDVLVSKGLVYALTSGVLTVLFLGIALIAGVSVGGADTRVVAALALALLVTFLAQPLRRRLERRVARLLYGEQPRGLMALARLDRIVASELDARQLGARIADGLRTAVGAPWAGVWLSSAGDGALVLRPLAVVGAEPGPSAVLPRPAATALAGLAGAVAVPGLPDEVADAVRPVLPAGAALVAPLATRGALLGLIVCGGRPSQPFGEDEAELVGIVARESALALRNLRLEDELRQRLEQIERQAAELHSSRQRLIAVQDEERRRIERDLHDGAQQQLVALAARLRLAASRAGPDAALTELADEAEEAVFALQELARGIFPSLLADRGLVAALQAHAARLPADIRVEADAGLRGRRFGPAVEAALYFVGLEAMTNAIKHAPGARVGVSLRADRVRDAVTLAVRDDGPGVGFGRSPEGSGLQNMRDRIEALGGVFSLEEAPHGGTLVRATVANAGLGEATERTDAQERA